jgi:hypothetical protein
MEVLGTQWFSPFDAQSVRFTVGPMALQMMSLKGFSVKKYYLSGITRNFLIVFLDTTAPILGARCCWSYLKRATTRVPFALIARF